MWIQVAIRRAVFVGIAAFLAMQLSGATAAWGAAPEKKAEKPVAKIDLNTAISRKEKLEKEFELATKQFGSQYGDLITSNILQSQVESTV